MQQPQRYIPSVSDLYGTDEIEFLLDEIRDLEPACCQLDDVQDFEIAGSRAGELSLSLESPLGTVTSWDSHVHYKHRMGMTPAPWGVALHCDPQHLKTPTGIVRILLVLSSAACLACECSAGTVQVGLFLLPLIGRLRLMVFCALFSLLITCLMLFLDISHIALMFPFNWGKVNAYLYLSVGLIFILGSSLLLHMVLFADAFQWVPRHTKDTLFISAIIGYVCSIEAMILSGIALYPRRKYRPVLQDDESDLFLDGGRELSPMSPMSPMSSTDVPNHNQVSQSDGSNHYQYNKLSTACNQKPYIPAKRPDQANNKRPTLGHTQKSNNRYREGYHYQPIASTSQQSPTFVLDDAIPGPSSRSNESA
ncbi:uncharacterized protein LOC119082614 [Bradysia coprophila]|uniref:uncharacterized protein LOC119082614 n=1 Tax=Bradysia coprophila TaxID=38358 RepID=UPI00187D9024|nr:uncharacterized protein LOC119082614 [Bradysia coprophila]XP_037048067.1 uncharacterized protein LOC119082614 [Bradysia coprophila]